MNDELVTLRSRNESLHDALATMRKLLHATGFNLSIIFECKGYRLSRTEKITN
jgi:hypothetical protein